MSLPNMYCQYALLQAAEDCYGDDDDHDDDKDDIDTDDVDDDGNWCCENYMTHLLKQPPNRFISFNLL